MISVDIKTFRSATRELPFDVYLKVSDENFVHVFAKTTGIDYKRLTQYLHKGVTELFVRDEDLIAYQAFVARPPAHEVFKDPQASREKKIAALINMTEQNMAELFSGLAVSAETAASAELVVKGYVDLMTQSPHTLSVILQLVSHGQYLYYHTIAVSIFSMLIAKGTGKYDDKTLKMIALGGFLHDIGLAPDTVNEYEDQGHPKAALQLIENTPGIPEEVRYIVYQHHEEPGGGGFPNRLAGPAIFAPSLIVGLADAFSELISRRPGREAYPAGEAIALLMEQARKTGKYDIELIKTTAAIFLQGKGQAQTLQKIRDAA
jgi:putative nucleotidyltransferase with HDIG domain